MELKRKLTILADAAKHDASCASGGSRRTTPQGGLGNTEGMGICHSYTPDGRCVSLLKILLTNYCVFDCAYCESRISSDVPRARFTPDEVVALTLDLYARNYIEGLFLSSGILKDADTTMLELTRVAELLRNAHAFGGYIHLKCPPGVSADLLRKAGAYADRLSVNMELSTDEDLARLAPEKSHRAIESVMKAVHTGIVEERKFTPAGQTTQVIVGATPADDRTILETSDRLYAEHRLRRVYYAAFSPIVHHAPNLPTKAPPLVREHRLYEADWLVRQYGFTLAELFEGAPDGNLDPGVDPKLAWALRHRELFPVDVNLAARELLLRVPGLGVRNVKRIVDARRHRALRWDDLARMRVAVRRASAFLVTADGVHPAARQLDSLGLRRLVEPPKQLGLFEARAQGTTGEL